jgi:hypothetical protein
MRFRSLMKKKRSLLIHSSHKKGIPADFIPQDGVDDGYKLFENFSKIKLKKNSGVVPSAIKKQEVLVKNVHL